MRRASLALFGAMALAAAFTAVEAESPPAAAASPAPGRSPFPLTVDSIMRGDALVGHPPSGLRFSGDSKDLYFEWRDRGEDEDATYVVSREGGSPRRLGEDERRRAPAAQGRWDRAGRRLLFQDQGDVVVVDTVARTRRQVTRTSGGEANPRWARRDTHVAFTRDNGFFLAALGGEGDALVEVFEAAPPRAEPKLTESQRFLKEEERALLDAVREMKEKRERDEEKRKKAGPPRLEITDKQSLSDALLSPDDRHVFALIAERPEGARLADMPKYVTESTYVETVPTRSRVGDAQEKRRLAVFDRNASLTVWASAAFAGPPRRSPSPSPSPSPSSSPTPTPSASPSPPGPKERQDAFREVRWSMPIVSADGRHAVASVFAADRKDRWLVAVDPASGDTRVLFHEHDDAWVRPAFDPAVNPGPYGTASFGFLPDERTVWFTSETDGWMHLYTVDASGGSARPLTSGRWEVTHVELTPSRRLFLLATTEAGAGERHLYTMPLGGGPRTRLTADVGSNLGLLSPDERTLGLIRSTGNRPPEVFLAEARPGSALRQVTTSPTAEWLAFPWIDPPVVTFRARDGASVPARLFTPEPLSRPRHPNRPAVVFIHGAGYLQNAHRYWSFYYREYMFHHLLADRGYVVLDVDYRGSAHYGRDWRTAIYGHMGGKDLDDVLDGAAWLAREQGVDPRRIGTYGGSYGGFLTLMALFTSPDTFASGAALRPVTDWAHYNDPYTSNILDRPPEQREHYRRSSPIHFAAGLKVPLLIGHGMVDDNVHFQDSVRLAQKLIELRKEDWELAMYPVERHGFERETSWADEYKRILKLFQRTLE